MLLNKTLKILAYLFVQFWAVILVELLALLVSSPVLLFLLSFLDAINKIPSFVQGRYLICWLVVSVPLFIGFLIYTEIKVHAPRKRLKNNKQNSNNK